MSQPERISEILKRREYKWLKRTPDLTGPPKPMTPDELDEARQLLAYEQQLEELRAKRGY